MNPLPGMATVAEYGTKFDADVAAARLIEAGYEAAVIGDPAHSVAPHHVTEPGFRVLVRDEVHEQALGVLGLDGRPDPESEALDAQFHLRRFADRPRWIRWATWALLIAIPGPLVIAVTVMLLGGAGRLFP